MLKKCLLLGTYGQHGGKNSPPHQGQSKAKRRDDLLIFSCVSRSKFKGFHKITLALSL